jgi:outer membrane murein-binding lipoprotein Lpp
MKKITTIFAFMLLAVALTSCGSKKSDAKKLGELACKAMKLSAKGDASSDEMKKIDEEGKALSAKLKEKYKDDKEFDSLLSEEFKNCK